MVVAATSPLMKQMDSCAALALTWGRTVVALAVEIHHSTVGEGRRNSGSASEVGNSIEMVALRIEGDLEPSLDALGGPAVDQLSTESHRLYPVLRAGKGLTLMVTWYS